MFRNPDDETSRRDPCTDADRLRTSLGEIAFLALYESLDQLAINFLADMFQVEFIGHSAKWQVYRLYWHIKWHM